MRTFLILLALALAGCSDGHRHHHRKPHHATAVVSVHHLADGRFVRQDDSGLFWFYMYAMHADSGSAAYVDNSRSYSYYASPNTAVLPTGGAWVSTSQLNVTPAQETQLEMELNDPRAEVVQESVEVAADGQPMDTADVATETQMELDLGNDPGVTGESSSESSDSSSSDSSSSSDGGSSDSGSSGGGDSGSSGGGDSGGGGE